MDDLVTRLSTGLHPVEVKIRPEATTERLKECLRRGYVHLKFTDTRGGTELGVALEPEFCRWSEDALDAGRGTIRLEGGLTLNFVRVRCMADIHLEDLRGEGCLSPVSE